MYFFINIIIDMLYCSPGHSVIKPITYIHKIKFPINCRMNIIICATLGWGREPRSKGSGKSIYRRRKKRGKQGFKVGDFSILGVIFLGMGCVLRGTCITLRVKSGMFHVQH